MPGTISIWNLKNINELNFSLPGQGVFLLAGANGAGKTSLLACLRRLGNSNAFAKHFVTSSRSNALDSFNGAEIVYSIGDRSVTYVYGGERWVPRPRSESHLLKRFGYPSVLYIGATAERLTARPEDFSLRRLKPASAFIRDGANTIFETRKFDDLKTINLQRGVGNTAFVLQSTVDGRNRYYSEKNFSLGELCILKFLRELDECPLQTLVLIDELELALHPKAQVALFQLLERIAAEKRLTVIVSTHSVSLLKRAQRRNIYFLENTYGIVTAIQGCFPTYALGNIAFDEERSPDVVIYVEDESARYLTEAFVKLCLPAVFGAQMSRSPTVLTAPIGPFMSVVRFLDRSDAMLPPATASIALLDGDVRDETLIQWRQQGQHALLAEFERRERQIRYLPWTPEVGLIEDLQSDRADVERRLRGVFANNQMRIRTTDLHVPANLIGRAKRDASKHALEVISQSLCEQLPNVSQEQIRNTLFALFAERYFSSNRADVLTLFGPILSARR